MHIKNTVNELMFLFSLQGYNNRYDINEGECYFIYASCKDVLVTSLIFPGIVILFAYVSGCYIFRFVFPENLATLTEKVHNCTKIVVNNLMHKRINVLDLNNLRRSQASNGNLTFKYCNMLYKWSIFIYDEGNYMPFQVY